MRVLVLSTSSAAATAVTRIVANALRETPDIVLGLPTGRTMVPVYEALVRAHRRGRADFRRAVTFNIDEFVGLPSGHHGSYRAFMKRRLFDHVNLPERAAHFPGMPHRSPLDYDHAIAEAGGLDLCIAGLGTNGHIGFNEPGPALEAGTHQVRLMPATRRANAYLFGGRWREVPTTAWSMGIGTILGARAVVLLATGSGKAAIVRRALVGPVTTRVPASLLQTHPNALVVLDASAARRLPSTVAI